MSNTPMSDTDEQNCPASDISVPDHIDILLSELGDRLKLGELSFNDSGFCNLRIGAGSHLSLVRNAEGEDLILLGELASELPLADPQLLRELFMTGLGPVAGGDGIGLDPLSSMLLMYRICDASQMDIDAFEDVLGGFLERQWRWIERIKCTIAEIGLKVEAISERGQRHA